MQVSMTRLQPAKPAQPAEPTAPPGGNVERRQPPQEPSAPTRPDTVRGAASGLGACVLNALVNVQESARR